MNKEFLNRLRWMARLCAIYLLVILAVGCSGNKKTTKVDRDLLSINGVVYTTADLWEYSNITLWQMEPKDLINEKVKEKLVSDFVEHKLLLQEAERREITLSQERLEHILIQLSTEQGEKELRAITGQYDISTDKVSKIISERLVVDALLKSVVNVATYVSESELKKFYETKKLTKAPMNEAHILHIFTTDNSTAHKAAKELASGIIFSEVAKKYSESPEASDGGDLGFIKQAEYPEFFTAAFRLKEGETSTILKSEYGYHIFKMVQYASANKNSYDNVKTILLAELYANKREERTREFINALRNNADIKELTHFTLAELFPAEQ